MPTLILTPRHTDDSQALWRAAGRLGWSWRGPGARGHHLWALSSTPEGTRVVTQETQRGPLPGLAAPLLRRVMPVGHAAWLRGIGRVVSRL